MRWTAAQLGLLAALLVACSAEPRGDSPHKVYVLLGFHSNFYHSWRGDTPDEAGFGTDIRIVREILRMLDDARSRGLEARAYWDTDNLFTLESILPEHAPDILEGMRRRVEAGLDEIALAPYNNGLFSAMTEDEIRAALRWSIHNPWGSGARDLFGTHTAILRPNEGMITTGTLPILREEGIEALILAYSEWPFTTFSNFVPTLPIEQRHNPTWLRLREDGPRLTVFPAVSIGDILNHISLERWMLDLRALQVSGEVDRDLAIHINWDADVESWLPQELPLGLSWFPNAGGLPEYIEAVNAYEWAEFTTPGEYLATHPPVGEVVVRQDLADGSFDGLYSWAEKLPSHALWTQLERGRLAARRAEAWLRDAPEALRSAARPLLWEGRDSSFFHRLRGLSTTHFGMSTPVVNEERQAVAERVIGTSLERAEQAEALAARVGAERAGAGARPPGALRSFAVRDLREPGSREAATPSLLRIPVRLAAPLEATLLVDGDGRRLAHSWVNPETLGDEIAAELWTQVALRPGETRRLHLLRAGREGGRAALPLTELANAHLELRLDEGGVASLRAAGREIGGPDFLSPFVTYQTERGLRTFRATAWRAEPLAGERWSGLQRARRSTTIPIETPQGRRDARIRVDWSLLEDAPWLVADVRVEYPYTKKSDILHTNQQKLRRYLDLRWIEVGPFELVPRLDAAPEDPLVVWKHNFLGVRSSYPLDYGRINPRNAELDAFNHQVTAGWVAVADGRQGLLLADRADVRSSFAFAPMRLRERAGRQALRLNPFGSYHGRQLDYSHLGGNGVGTEFTTLGSSSVRPNAPSFNGASERFSLMLAPFAGGAPPDALVEQAASFHHPPAVVTLGPGGPRLPEQVRAAIAALRLELARRDESPLPRPRAFLVSPTEGGADVVWDPPDDARASGYELRWRRAPQGDWRRRTLGPELRHRVAPLPNGEAYAFQVRALGPGGPSPWTDEQTRSIDPVPPVDIAGAAADASPWLLLRTLYYGLVHVLTTP